MDQVVYKELLEDAVEAAASCRDGGLILLGEPDVCDALRTDMQDHGALASLGPVVLWLDGGVQPLDRAALGGAPVDVVVIASDQDKEAMVRALPSLVSGTPRVLLAGYRHLEFRDDDYE